MSTDAVVLDAVTVTYPGSARPALVGADVRVGEGELCLVAGPTGAGKSTLLGAVCGLVPHFTGGTLVGRVEVAGRDTRTNLPRDLADVVGVVMQDPASGFVSDTVEAELAYGMEQLAVPPEAMRQRVEQVLDLLGLVGVRDRRLAELSAGEQQRVAIAAVLTVGPRVLVLDEPTSALDPGAADDVLAALTRLVHDLGMTVVLAEHRLERVVQYADTVVLVAADGTVTQGDPAMQMAVSPVFPPIVDLARLAGWTPPPLSVRAARVRATELRARLGGTRPAGPEDAVDGAAAPVLRATGVHVRHGPVHAVRGVDLDLAPGRLTAIMGRNGSGKTSLLWAIQGSGRRTAGSVVVGADGDARDPASCGPTEARTLVALVPQDPLALLYLPTVEQECAEADRLCDDSGRTRRILDRLTPGVDPAAHPRDLSEGQRLSVALAVQLSALPRVLLLDEPTRGLDYPAKARLRHWLREAARAGTAVLASSHDVEFVAESADRVLVLADGELVADGSTAEVLGASPLFAPQVARILHPEPYLTVGSVRAAVDGAS